MKFDFKVFTDTGDDHLVMHGRSSFNQVVFSLDIFQHYNTGNTTRDNHHICLTCCDNVILRIQQKQSLAITYHFESFTIATMTWLTDMEYLCQKLPWICSTCRKHFPVLSSIMTYHRVCNQINTTGATSGAGADYPSGAHEFSSGFSWGSCFSIFSFI